MKVAAAVGVAVAAGMAAAYLVAIAIPGWVRPQSSNTAMRVGWEVSLSLFPTPHWAMDHYVIRGAGFSNDSFDLRAIDRKTLLRCFAEKDLGGWPPGLRVGPLAMGAPWEFESSELVHTLTVTNTGWPWRCAYRIDVNDKDSINEGWPQSGARGDYRVAWLGLVVDGAAYAMPFVLVWGVWAGWRRWRRHAVGACAKCGYDLSGSPDGGCPECGARRAMTCDGV